MKMHKLMVLLMLLGWSVLANAVRVDVFPVTYFNDAWWVLLRHDANAQKWDSLFDESGLWGTLGTALGGSHDNTAIKVLKRETNNIIVIDQKYLNDYATTFDKTCYFVYLKFTNIEAVGHLMVALRGGTKANWDDFALVPIRNIIEGKITLHNQQTTPIKIEKYIQNNIVQYWPEAKEALIKKLRLRSIEEPTVAGPVFTEKPIAGQPIILTSEEPKATDATLLQVQLNQLKAKLEELSEALNRKPRGTVEV